MKTPKPPRQSPTIQLDPYPPDQRLDVILAETLKIPRQSVRGLFDHDCVRLDGRLCAEPGTRRGSASQLTVDYNPSHRLAPIGKGWSRRPFNVIYEDREILVVTKHAGVLTNPTDDGKGKEKGTLQHWIAEYYELTKQKSPQGKVTPFIVHRLDRDTSGVLVTAKDRKTAEALIAQFKERKPDRKYIALVAGVMNSNGPDRGTFRSHFLQDRFLNIQSARKSPAKDSPGLEAITHFEIVQRYQDITQVEVTLETGRRNQIRVHFAEAGHPVLGDSRYQSQKAAHPDWTEKRLALHAASLGFTHPVTGKPFHFVDAPPLCFDRVIKAQQSLSGGPKK